MRELLEWARLGERLQDASPEEFAEVAAAVFLICERHEALAAIRKKARLALVEKRRAVA